MIRFGVLVLLVVGICVKQTDARAYRNAIWEDCTRSESPVTLTNLDISPNPVLMPGQVHFTIQGFSNRTLGSSRLVLEIRKKIRWFYVPLPCLLNIGSCTYDNMCTMLDRMVDENWAGITHNFGNDIKNMLIRNGMTPGLCPQPPRTISIIRNPLQLPEMPSVLRWFSEGQYKAKVRVIDNSSEEELVCFKLKMTLARPQEECSGYLGCWF